MDEIKELWEKYLNLDSVVDKVAFGTIALALLSFVILCLFGLITLFIHNFLAGLMCTFFVTLMFSVFWLIIKYA